MKSVVVITGSPSPTSKTARVGDFTVNWLQENNFVATHVRLREIPAEALLTGNLDDSALKAAVDLVSGADGVVLGTPVFKGSYSGLMKAFLDILPQFGFRRKTLLLLGTGGSLAHVLSLDYGFRPVVQTMKPRAVTQSLFILEQDLVMVDTAFTVQDQARAMLHDVLNEFSIALSVDYDLDVESRPLLHKVG